MRKNDRGDAPSTRGGNKRDRGRKRGGNDPGPPRPESVFHDLQRLFRKIVCNGDLRNRTPGTILIPFDPDGDPKSFGRTLLELFHEYGGDTAQENDTGKVFCHHCGSSSCVHAVPPDPLSVFSGYTPTGLPSWTEFLSLLLDAGDSRIDTLFQEGPEILARCQSRSDLTREQLQIFGRVSPRYHVLGQVVAGYLPLPRTREGGKCAVTIQAVLYREKGRPRLRLNAVGRLSGGEDLHLHLLRHPEPELEGLVAAASDAMKTLERRVLRTGMGSERAADAVLPHIPPVLTRLARGLERCFRRRRRRTVHARERRSQRPAVGMALKDTEKALEEAFLFDASNRTFIVIGQNRRIHVFGMDGRHVTSMVLSREAVHRRLELRRWRAATRKEITEIRSRIFA